MIGLVQTSLFFVAQALYLLALFLPVWVSTSGCGGPPPGGHIFMGFGIAVLDSATQKFFCHWFGASGLELAFGLESVVSKTVDLVVS